MLPTCPVMMTIMFFSCQRVEELHSVFAICFQSLIQASLVAPMFVCLVLLPSAMSESEIYKLSWLKPKPI